MRHTTLSCLLLVIVVASVQTLGLQVHRTNSAQTALALQTQGSCSFGASCCYAPSGSLHRCPHVGGVCCPQSRYCCPANHACVGSITQPACKKIEAEDSCGNSCNPPPPQPSCGGSQCDDQPEIPIRVTVDKDTPAAKIGGGLEGVAALVAKMPTGVTVTNTRTTKGLTVTTTITKQGHHQGAMNPPSDEESESAGPSLESSAPPPPPPSSESSVPAPAPAPAPSSSEDSLSESSLSESSTPPMPESSAPFKTLDSSELSSEEAAPSPPTEPGRADDIGSSPPDAGSASPSASCGDTGCTPKRGKLKINSNVEITIGGKKQA